MIDESKLEFNDFGEVILQKKPYMMSASMDVVNDMISRDINDLTPFWSQIIKDWKEKGILN